MLIIQLSHQNYVDPSWQGDVCWLQGCRGHHRHSPAPPLFADWKSCLILDEPTIGHGTPQLAHTAHLSHAVKRNNSCDSLKCDDLMSDDTKRPQALTYIILFSNFFVNFSNIWCLKKMESATCCNIGRRFTNTVLFVLNAFYYKTNGTVYNCTNGNNVSNNISLPVILQSVLHIWSSSGEHKSDDWLWQMVK